MVRLFVVYLHRTKDDNMKKDLYKILGVDKTATASEIKKAYRKKAKEHHPDKGGDPEVFKDISHANSVLSDETKRQNYDRTGNSDAQAFNSNANAWEKLFREQELQRQKQRYSVGIAMRVTLEEIFNGAKKTFKYKRQILCKGCDGIGGSEPSKCTRCDGSGRIHRVHQTQFGTMQEDLDCDQCNQGYHYKQICKTCNGSGVQSSVEEIEVEIPKSIPSGSVMEKADLGNIMPNGKFSVLNIRVDVIQHEKYQVSHQYNLVSELKVPYETLMLGGQVEFKTIDGGKVKLSVKPFSKIGDRLQLKGKGLHLPHLNKTRGNQILILNIDLPSGMTSEEQELLEKLKKLKE